MKEEWKPVKGFEEYAEISNLGQIHYYGTGRGRYPDERFTYGYENYKGYLYVGIGNKKFRVNRLVYMTFVGEIPDGLEVNHIDEDKHNNCLDNLNLMTPSQNTNWGTGNARRAVANKNHPKRSKAVQALNPKTLEVVMEFPSTAEAERQYGFNHSAVSKCCRGKLKSYKGYIWRNKDI